MTEQHKGKRFKMAYARFARDFSSHSITNALEEADALVKNQSPDPSTLAIATPEQQLRDAEEQLRLAEQKGKQIDAIGPIFLDIAEEFSQLSRHIQERVAIQGDIIIDAAMEAQAQRVLQLLSQLEACYGDKSPFAGHKKEIIRKTVRDFSEAVSDIFELPPPARQRT